MMFPEYSLLFSQPDYFASCLLIFFNFLLFELRFRLRFSSTAAHVPRPCQQLTGLPWGRCAIGDGRGRRTNKLHASLISHFAFQLQLQLRLRLPAACCSYSCTGTSGKAAKRQVGAQPRPQGGTTAHLSFVPICLVHWAETPSSCGN